MKFKEFIEHLRGRKKLVVIKKEVNIEYEIATLMKMMDGTPLLFENVSGYDMPVSANICSSRNLVAEGLGIDGKDLIKKMLNAIENPVEPEIKNVENYKKIENLEKLPILLHYPIDGGKYISSAVVIANDSEYGLNSSYHRMMVIDKDRVVMRILPRDFNKYIERGMKEFAICIGNPISVAVASAISMPTGINELAIANSLYPTPLIKIDGHAVPESEIVMIAEVTDEMHDEGPFLDLTETPDIVRKQRVAKIKKIYAKENAIYHALLPGGLEHKTLMGTPKEPTIFYEVSKVCDVKDVYITPGGCSWLHAVVSIRKKNADDGKRAIEHAFRGHKSMKHVFVVDDDIDVHDWQQVEWAMATRFQGSKDMVMKQEKGSSLDPSADPITRETTKIGFDLTIPWDKDIKNFKKPELPMKINPDDYL
ncbi:MAG TPA: UbiD family decarboxylase [Thermoplasmatales archaeon]|nr:UbiD family decarboxylase [Thermoplasmatales archaeon]